MKSRLLGGSILGHRASSGIPPQVTSSAAAPWSTPTADEILEGIRTALQARDLAALRPSVLVVGDHVPNALTVTDGRALCFMTLSRAGLDAIVEQSNPASPVKGATPSLLGLPIVDLDRLGEGDSYQARGLASYYHAAIRAYVAGLAI